MRCRRADVVVVVGIGRSWSGDDGADEVLSERIHASGSDLSTEMVVFVVCSS